MTANAQRIRSELEQAFRAARWLRSRLGAAFQVCSVTTASLEQPFGAPSGSAAGSEQPFRAPNGSAAGSEQPFRTPSGSIGGSEQPFRALSGSGIGSEQAPSSLLECPSGSAAGSSGCNGFSAFSIFSGRPNGKHCIWCEPVHIHARSEMKMSDAKQSTVVLRQLSRTVISNSDFKQRLRTHNGFEVSSSRLFEQPVVLQQA